MLDANACDNIKKRIMRDSKIFFSLILGIMQWMGFI